MWPSPIARWRHPFATSPAHKRVTRPVSDSILSCTAALAAGQIINDMMDARRKPYNHIYQRRAQYANSSGYSTGQAAEQNVERSPGAPYQPLQAVRARGSAIPSEVVMSIVCALSCVVCEASCGPVRPNETSPSPTGPPSTLKVTQRIMNGSAEDHVRQRRGSCTAMQRRRTAPQPGGAERTCPTCP
jgi:hypothetical protein